MINRQPIYEKALEAAEFIDELNPGKAEIGIILGTGLGGVAESMEVETEIPYSKIPHFPLSTVEGHKGSLLIGTIGQKRIAIFSGRFHYYEGYDTKQITFPVRVLNFLGVDKVMITSVSGSVNPDFKAGSLVAVRDHINFMPEHPLRGMNDDRLGPRFPDMSVPYDPEFRRTAGELAGKLGINLHEGVYLALQGPSLETPAEYEMIHRMGADLVGMSSVPEVIVARHMGMRVGFISMVSNLCYPLSEIALTTHESVLEVAKANAPVLEKLIIEILSNWK